MLILIPLMLVLATGVARAREGDSLHRVTSPGSNMIMTIPDGWRFLTSAEQGRDSMNEIATLTGTILTPDTGVIVFIERMNRTYPASMLRDRINAVGMRQYCAGVVDSILGGVWIFHDFVSPPSFQSTPLEFHFTVKVTPPSGDTASDSVRIMEFFYRRIGGIDVRIHAICKPDAYLAKKDDLSVIMKSATPIVDEFDDTESDSLTTDSKGSGSDQGPVTVAVVVIIIVAVIVGVIAWRTLRHRGRRR